jgi:serine phosphatase RsbU (regulator of sigma subunit)/PAS domain-containing protein
MTTLSVLLVDNQISSAATIVEAISEYLTHYELSVIKSARDALIDTEAIPQVVLLRVTNLDDHEQNRLSFLTLAYPQAIIILIVPPEFIPEDPKLLTALKNGVDDFVPFSEAGLISLGRRLARLQKQQIPNPEALDLSFLTALNNQGSDLAVQGIGPDNRIHTWNPGAEVLFELPQESVIGSTIDNLAMPRNSIIRLKDILDQARTTGHPFTIDQFPLQDSRDQRRWARVYVYPLLKNSTDSTGSVESVFILYADVTSFKEIELNSKRYSQELFEETQQGLEELSVLYEASTVVSTNWNTQEVLNTLIQQIVRAINVSRGFIVSWSRSQSQGTVKASFEREEILPQESSKTDIPPSFSFTDRPALLTIIKQKRVVLFELGNLSLNEAERLNMELHNCYARLIIPLIVKGKTIGWAELWEMRPGRRFTVDEIRLGRMLSIQSAVALENAQYLQQMQQTLEETTALYHVSSTLATTQDPQNIMNIVLQEYLRVLELKQGRVIVFDFKKKVGVIRIDVRDNQVGGNQVTLAEGKNFSLENNPLYRQLMQSRHPVVVDDTEAEWLRVSRTGSGPALPVKDSWVSKNTHSMLVIPIQVIEDIVGVIIAEADRPDHIFDAWAISLGQAMADQLGIALQNVELYELESKRRHQAETLREVSFVVGSSLNLDEVLERILEQLRRVITYDSAAIHLVEGNRRRIIAVQGFAHPEQVIGLTFPVKLDESEPGSIAIHSRKPFLIGDVAKVDKVFKALSGDQIKSWLGIPLIARGQVIGLITIDRAEPNAFAEEDIDLTLAFANQAAIALENARLYEIEVREIERELELAHEIQETLLPQFTPQVAGLQVSGRTTPVRQIGGDFFHFFTIDQGHFGLAIGDVSGKGVPAALYMAAAMTAIDAEIKNKNPGPGQLLNSLHQILYKRLRQNKMNIGLQVATFSPLPLPDNRPAPEGIGRKIMTIANAGMIAPIVAIKTGCHFLSVSGLPLGSPVSEPEYVEDIILMEPFTAVIFTSDGIVEAKNEAGEMFSFERLEATVSEIIHSNDAEVIAEHIIYKVQEFTGDVEEQHDDMTVVVVLVKG